MLEPAAQRGGPHGIGLDLRLDGRGLRRECILLSLPLLFYAGFGGGFLVAAPTAHLLGNEVQVCPDLLFSGDFFVKDYAFAFCAFCTLFVPPLSVSTQPGVT